jgi:predicted enzyme related to lactoylglutathione lyase
MILGEVSVGTNDVIKLADFYRKILGINLENNSAENKNEIHQFIITEGTSLTIIHKNGKTNNNGNISLAFTVDNVDEEYGKLLKLGVKIIDPPKTQPWGARNMHFCDPDGNDLYFRTIQINNNIV